MKLLFICNTYMQVIIAVWAKMRMFPGDDVDIVLSDFSVNADKRSEGLRKTGLFRRVKYIETKAMSHYPTRKNIFDSFSLRFKKNNIYSNFFWDDMDYDRIFFHNPFFETFAAFDKTSRSSGRKNPPELIRFEEGGVSVAWLPLLEYGLGLGNLNSREKFFYILRILCKLIGRPDWVSNNVMTYSDLNTREKILHILCKLTGRPDLVSNTRKYMCFYPELLGTSSIMKNVKRKDYPHIRIPMLTSDKDFLEKLNTVFDYDPSADSFPQKYICFATSAEVDGHNIGETEIIMKISELVGKDNLLVKLHPRDRRDVYERTGLTVSRNSSIPWEVMQLNHDFTKHVFISLSSGSTINITAMKNENIPVFMLFPLVTGKDKSMDSVIYPTIRKVIEHLQAMGVCRSVKITDKLEDVLM